MEHYRCFKVYFPKTRTVRQVDTVKFIEGEISLPVVTVNEFLKQAAGDIVDILKHPHSNTIPSLQEGEPTNKALTNLVELL